MCPTLLRKLAGVGPLLSHDAAGLLLQVVQPSKAPVHQGPPLEAHGHWGGGRQEVQHLHKPAEGSLGATLMLLQCTRKEAQNFSPALTRRVHKGTLLLPTG